MRSNPWYQTESICSEKYEFAGGLGWLVVWLILILGYSWKAVKKDTRGVTIFKQFLVSETKSFQIGRAQELERERSHHADTKATGKCTCKGNPSQRPSTPTEEETSPGGVKGLVENHDRITIGWAPPQSKNVDLLAGRPEEAFHKLDMGDVCQTGRLGRAEGGG